MSWWPFKKDRPQGPSDEALSSLLASEKQLKEARSLRAQAEVAGSSLADSHGRNHIVESLERALQNNGRTA